MGIYIAKNNAASTLAGALTNATASLTVQTGHGDRFPVIAGTDYTYLTLEDSLHNIETIKVTARTLGADSMSIERGQLGTVARSWLAGDLVECRPLAQLLQDTINHLQASEAAHPAAAVTVAPTGDIAATTVQAALAELDGDKLAKAGGTMTGDLNLTAALKLAGSAGSAGQVIVSDGVKGAWGSAPATFASESKGSGSLLVTTSTAGALDLLLNQTENGNGLVDYRLVSGAEWEVGTGRIFETITGAREWADAQAGFGGNTVRSMIFANGLFVAVGDGGKISTSQDGKVWTVRDSGVTEALRGVTYGGGQFVAVGSRASSTSADGISWVGRTQSSNLVTTVMCSGGGKTIAVGYTVVRVSDDHGATWAEYRKRFYHGTTLSVADKMVWTGTEFLLFPVVPSLRGTYFATTDGIDWDERILPDECIINDVAAAGSLIVALCDNQKAYQSTDGVNWGVAPLSAMYTHIAHNGTLFCAIQSGSTAAATSTDGVTWTARTLPATFSVSILSGRPGYFCMIPGTNSTSYSSQDGINWTSGTLPTFVSAWYAPKVCGDTFIAMNGSGTSGAVSANGISWTTKTMPFAGMADGITWDGTCFIAAARYAPNTGKYATSTDGTTWTTTNTITSTAVFVGVAWGADKYVAMVNDSTYYPATSTDGVNWTPQAVPAAFGGAYLSSVVFLNGQFIAFGSAGMLATSPDGVTWTGRTSQFAADAIYSVAWNGSVYVAVGQNGKVSYSPDSVTWTAGTLGFSTSTAATVSVLGSKFIASGSGKTATSTDGNVWTDCTSVSGVSLHTMTCGAANATTHVLMGSGGISATTADGVTWDKPQTFGAANVIDCIFANGIFVACGSSGLIATSPDGKVWTLRSNPFASTDVINRVIYTAGKFIACGTGGKVCTSPDGVIWTYQSSSATAMVSNDIYDIAYSGTLFVVTGNNGKVATSPDGITWTARTSATSSGMYYLIYASGRFTALSTSSYNATNTGQVSPDGITWTNQQSFPSGFVPSSKVVAHGDVFYLGNANGKFSESRDGFSWTTKSRLRAQVASSYSNAGGVRWLNANGYRQLKISVNGRDWLTVGDPLTDGAVVRGVVFGAGVCVAYGSAGYLAATEIKSRAVLLSRASVKASSNGDAKVNFGAAVNSVALSPVNLPEVGCVIEQAGTPYAGTWSPCNGAAVNTEIASALLGKLPRSTKFAGTFYTASLLVPASHVGFSVAYGNGRLCVVEENSVAGNAYSAVSLDGVNFSTALTATTYMRSIAFGAGLFVSVKYSPANTTCFTSPDGLNWTSRTLPASKAWNDVAWNGSSFCAVSDGTACATSTDGVTWAAGGTGSSTLVVGGGGVFITYNSGTTAATSPTGATWTAATLPANVKSIIWNGSLFILTTSASSSTVYTSATGATGSWTARTLPSAGIWVPTLSGSACILLDAGGYTVLYSADGITWTKSFDYLTPAMISGNFIGDGCVKNAPPFAFFVGNGLCVTDAASPYAVLPTIATRSDITPPRIRVA